MSLRREACSDGYYFSLPHLQRARPAISPKVAWLNGVKTRKCIIQKCDLATLIISPLQSLLLFGHDDHPQTSNALPTLIVYALAVFCTFACHCYKQISPVSPLGRCTKTRHCPMDLIEQPAQMACPQTQEWSHIMVLQFLIMHGDTVFWKRHGFCLEMKLFLTCMLHREVAHSLARVGQIKRALASPLGCLIVR